MREDLKELTFFQSDWNDDETREHKLALLRAKYGLEYVRHEQMPNEREYRVFFKERSEQ